MTMSKCIVAFGKSRTVGEWAVEVGMSLGEHSQGATFAELCVATGLEDSQLAETFQGALAKLRTQALSGDADALNFISSLVGDDRDTEELLDLMAAKYPQCDPERAEPADAMDGELVSLDELEAGADNDNGMDDELARLGYASSWAA